MKCSSTARGARDKYQVWARRPFFLSLHPFSKNFRPFSIFLNFAWKGREAASSWGCHTFPAVERTSTIIFPHDISLPLLLGKKWNYGNCPTAQPLRRNRALWSSGFLWRWPGRTEKAAKATIWQLTAHLVYFPIILRNLLDLLVVNSTLETSKHFLFLLKFFTSVKFGHPSKGRIARVILIEKSLKF